jgi:hypothetical protein
MNNYGVSHQIIKLKFLANHIKDQVILIHFEIMLFFERKWLYNDLVETKDIDAYSNWLYMI